MSHPVPLRHSCYLDRDEQDLGCKPRNFPAASTLFALLLFLRYFVFGMFEVLANIGEEYANLRRSEEDLGAEVVFRMDVAWSIDFGHWF